jgi:hypothetical protein
LVFVAKYSKIHKNWNIHDHITTEDHFSRSQSKLATDSTARDVHGSSKGVVNKLISIGHILWWVSMKKNSKDISNCLMHAFADGVGPRILDSDRTWLDIETIQDLETSIQ